MSVLSSAWKLHVSSLNLFEFYFFCVLLISDEIVLEENIQECDERLPDVESEYSDS